jgi:glycerol transport system permease protein
VGAALDHTHCQLLSRAGENGRDAPEHDIDAAKFPRNHPDMTSKAQTTALLAPAVLVLLASGVLPLAFVFFYSVNDTFAGNSFLFVGLQWFKQVLASPDFQWALLRSLSFSLLALAVQLPLGLYIALKLPRQGKLASTLVVLMALPLLTPTIVVGYLFKVLSLPNAGLLTNVLALLGIPLDMNSKIATWAVLILMDCWHWTSLVVLLAYAGLKAIPDDYYRAARIDGASPWAVFRFVQLPRLKMVLAIAALLRFMDSFVIYTEAYVVTRGGPGVSTNFLSHELVQTSTIQFDLGEGSAMAVIYFFIVLAVSLLFFRQVMQKERAA